MSNEFRIGKWNVEGLIELKLVELERIMKEQSLSILCMAATHELGVDSYVLDSGCLVILLGGVVG